LQGLEVVKNTPDLATAVKRLADLDRYKGSSIALPKDGDEASATAFTEAVTKRGFIPGEVPADPNGYDADVDLTKAELTDEWKAGRLKEFHSLGLTKTQAKAALQREVAAAEALFVGMDVTDRADVRKAAEKYGIDGSPASIVKLLKELGKTMQEDNTKPIGGGTGGSLLDIDVQIAELDDKILKLPEYDPRAKQALEQKFALMKKKAAIQTGDKSIENLALADIKFGR